MDKLSTEQYAFICTEADAILQEYASSVPVISIPWLHVLNGHPSNQLKYIPVFKKRNFWLQVKVFSYFTGSIFLNLFLSLISFVSGRRNHPWVQPDLDVLMVSHLINLQVKQDAPDFYFDELPGYLAEHKHKKSTLALIDHTTSFFNAKKKRRLSGPKKYIIPKRLGLQTEIRILGNCVSSFFLFFKRYLKETDRDKRSFLLETTLQTLAPASFHALRLHANMIHVIDHSNVATIFMTWEGHSWERLIVHATKHAKRKIKSIGYQHTILFPDSHGLKRFISDAFNPDIVLTVGTVTAGILTSSGGLKDAAIIPYGSHRRSQKKVDTLTETKIKKCLVTPEGVPRESNLLFNYAIEAAKQLPEWQFVLRLHPILSFEKLQEQNEQLRNLPGNVRLSTEKNIDNDFADCQLLLYRSSSVAIFSVLAGLKPVCLELENEISIDPLYMLDSWKVTVKEVDEFIGLLHSANNISLTEKNTEHAKAVKFCEEYMMLLDRSVFDRPIFGFN